ncbi:MAG: Sfum_1244 family protein [Desulfobaccales bacterium]
MNVLRENGAMIPPTLIEAVRWNCDIASAGQAGLFSLCGLLLRLRQLFKWEHRLPPWREAEPEAVLEWIARRERTWDELEEADWRALAWGRAAIDPFAVETLNDHLLPQGLAYGAGLSRGLTPTFFLGELLEVRREGALTILILGPELARDLDASPALCQGTLIYARRQALAFYLWDHLSDPTQQKNAFLHVALQAYHLNLQGLLRDPEAHQERFEAFLEGEMEAAIRHEMGEALEPGLKSAFPALLERFSQTRVELWVRALKDVLAEVNDWGRLAYLIDHQSLPSLAVMLAWRPGLYPALLPELELAFQELLATGNWEPVDAARRQALARLRQTAADLNALLDSPAAESTDWLQAEIHRRFLAPLGL